MITPDQEEMASLYAAGALSPAERESFEAAIRASAELKQHVSTLREAAAAFALSVPQRAVPADLKAKILERIGGQTATASATRTPSGFAFIAADASTGWKQLPVAGAWIKFLSLDRARGYAVLLGKLEPGVRYPAHFHEGAEELFILSGDLHIGEQTLNAGDFHHADAGTEHPVNFSEGGCTLLAVLPAEHELVQFARA